MERMNECKRECNGGQWKQMGEVGGRKRAKRRRNKERGENKKRDLWEDVHMASVCSRK